ncbi:GNAT family protein [Brachybacterium huguangmaarense]
MPTSSHAVARGRRYDAAMPSTWPTTLRDRDLVLRPLRRSDRRAWERLRAESRAWLAPWEATEPDPVRQAPGFAAMRRMLEDAGRRGAMLPLAIVDDGRLAGQITAGPILYGSQSSAMIGYWVGRPFAGRGLAPRALALVIDHCFAGIGLHRVEVDIRPENTASLRVAEKLHLRDEGVRRGLLHVDGAWRDHRSFALTAEEVRTGPDGRGVLARLLAETAPRA